MIQKVRDWMDAAGAVFEGGVTESSKSEGESERGDANKFQAERERSKMRS